MNVLVVGAGAVGATYARALKKGGANLTFLVRPKYVDEVKPGLRLWILSRGGAKEEQLLPDAVISEVSSQTFDQVWLCIPSTGVEETWLSELAKKTGDAAIVDLTPDHKRRALDLIGRDRLVEGLIPFIAYQTPLKGTVEEGRAPGIAIWLPPLAATPMSGPRAQEAVDALKRGGMNAKVVEDVTRNRALGGAFLNSFIAQLEVAGWSLSGVKKRLDESSAEAVTVMQHEIGGSAGPFPLLAKPWVMRTGLSLAQVMIPIPLEVYLQYHFTKVGPQTRVMLKSVADAADKHALDVPHLRKLASALLS